MAVARRLAVFACSVSHYHRLGSSIHTKLLPVSTSVVKSYWNQLQLISRNMTSEPESRAGEEREGEESEGGRGEGVSGEGEKYPYLQRGFTSEIFKIEIQNIPKYIGYTVRAVCVCFFLY